MGTVVATDDGGLPIEGHVKRDFDRCTGEEAMVIQKAWREERLAGSGKRQSNGTRWGRNIGDG